MHWILGFGLVLGGLVYWAARLRSLSAAVVQAQAVLAEAKAHGDSPSDLQQARSEFQRSIQRYNAAFQPAWLGKLARSLGYQPIETP
ncbi:hypothetical protein K2X33_12100 [bacterium]|nr:hypothetical protein [bacterium]